MSAASAEAIQVALPALAQDLAQGKTHKNPDAAGTSRRLIIFIHGLYKCLPKYREFDRLLALLRVTFPGYDIATFRYFGTYWSSSDPNALAERLGKFIDKRGNGYDKIVLIGHSFGCLILRKAVLMALQDPERWLDRVDRLILLAGTNRGYIPPGQWYVFLAFIAGILQSLFAWLPWFRLGRLAVHAIRGSDWLNQLRMAWISDFPESGRQPPIAIQVRGTRDRLVNRDDSIDVTYFDNAMEIEVDDAGHGHFTLVPRDQRPETIATMAVLEAQILRAMTVIPLARPDRDPCDPDDVVFLVHGIRDFAEWHETLGVELQHAGRAATPPRRVEIISITYGYFSALQFLYPMARRRCVRAFVDRYVQARARFRHATFSAGAHSNGTYVLARGLRDHPYVTLRNVYLAGSVLPRWFPWEDLRDRVVLVRNDCANRDWPVGVLCLLLQWVHWDLGTAGVDGFQGPAVWDSRAFVTNNQYVDGNHGAALESRLHPNIAAYLLHGDPLVPSDLTDNGRGKRRLAVGAVAVLLAVAIVVLYYGTLHWLGWFLDAPPHRGWSALVVVVLTILLLSLLLLV